ncbi:hypothetical protein PACILC2_19730 [Paenibacillus cisolokensis]|jgi:hypothetical protein|uniref:DUF2178 domain-containing protein n=1 Tax=Paenibacillus cisolokensis TaxID=1658519 RepID=A0ABQ4N5C0_9BACL|nr:hypothetical protein [Paenibacillus cisolokensis]GIQ63405.1 hypothetical protein PACILC2_19730 [Paenibacillus cisolokensis]
MQKNMGKWNLTFRAISILAGAVLGLTLVYIIQEGVNLSVLLGALTATIILIVINVIKVRMQNDTIPDTDERTVKNVLKFFVFSSHILLGILFIALSMISFMGVKLVPISYLWIIIIGYLLIMGIGAFIVSRR